MSSRFEQRRSRASNAAMSLSLVPPTDEERHDTSDSANEERPWQTLVRKLRQLIALEEVDQSKIEPEEKPALRLLPGGRLDESDEPRRSQVMTRGKWH